MADKKTSVRAEGVTSVASTENNGASAPEPAGSGPHFSRGVLSLALDVGIGLALALLAFFILSTMGMEFKLAVGSSAVLAFLALLFTRNLIRPLILGPEPETEANAKGKTQPEAPEPKDSLREVVETIVFVVVLVLILKSFAAEAFVIPTGSMAETLWGYQTQWTCSQCGYKFPVNVSKQVDPQEGPPMPITGCTCPNCRAHQSFGKKEDWDSGDRVLVGKFLWDSGLKRPERFDVTVFKFPQAPQQKQTPVNYIKRMTGRPGETLGIYYGKLYFLEGIRYDEGAVNPLDLWKRDYMHFDDLALLISHEAEFQRMFDAFLTLPEADLRQFAVQRGELRTLLRQLLPFAGQDERLAHAFGATNDPDRLANTILHEAAPEKAPPAEVVTLVEQLRNLRGAIDRRRDQLLDALKALPGSDAYRTLSQRDDDSRRLVAFFSDHRDELKALRDAKKLHFTIPRRAPDKVMAMRRIVFDNDFQPSDLVNQPPRWQDLDGNAWLTSDHKLFDHPAAAAGVAGWHWLRYQHRLRRANDPSTVGDPEYVTDFMGYNTYEENGAGHPQPNDWAGDLMLECEVTVTQPGGELVLELSKGVDRFQAAFNLQDGTCTLKRLTYDPLTGDGGSAMKLLKTEPLGQQSSPLSKAGTYELKFANVDERLLVWVDGKLLFSDGVDYAAPTHRGPYANDLQPASVGVQGAAVKVQHLRLWRDTYYTPPPPLPGEKGDGEPPSDRSHPENWTRLRNLPARTMYVQPGHYLCMGDNSPESSDSRYWGTVPERLLLGRALLIYYPFPRAGRIK